MNKKITLTLREEMYKQAQDILKDDMSGIVHYNQLIGLGIKAYRSNPQLIARINHLESIVESIKRRLKDVERNKGMEKLY